MTNASDAKGGLTIFSQAVVLVAGRISMRSCFFGDPFCPLGDWRLFFLSDGVKFTAINKNLQHETAYSAQAI
jgi:hypothetical protein